MVNPGDVKPPELGATSYPRWALRTYRDRIAPVLEELARRSGPAWLETCGPGEDAMTRYRLFPGSLYLLWVETLLGELPAGESKVAAALECLHNASLHHDDVLDAHDSRRGVRTVRASKGTPGSLLAGDSLIGTAWRLLAEDRAPRAAETLELLATAWSRMVRGQAMDEPAAWAAVDPPFRQQHWMTLTREKLALGNAPGPVAALRAGRAELVTPLSRLHEEFSFASQVLNDVGDLYGWAGFHVLAQCRRHTAEEGRRKPTLATLWAEDSAAAPGQDSEAASRILSRALHEVRRLSDEALESLATLPLVGGTLPILRDFFARPAQAFAELLSAAEKADARS